MATQSNLEVRVTGRDELTPKLDKIESRLIRLVGAVGAGIAAVRITTAPVQQAVAFERELANVRKTTNFTTSEMDRLSSSLLALSTRVDVSALDLAKIAAAAGQQGLGREGVAGVVQFTDSVSRMASVLDITAEQAAEDIGKIANVFKIPLRDIEVAVSTFNEVSNNSTAQGIELLDVVRRIGDAAGTLNLQESISLAATGLDFGQSPEVVGTAFAKVFSSLVQKQSDFRRLLDANLGDSAKDWGAKLRVNGLEAFKDVLAALRKLEPAAQQNTIIKLFGGGRIGALVNKLVQDTTDTVLTRNFAAATTGSAGLSAIKEQATVLNTVQAQAKLALNTLVRAGVQASEQLLVPLTRYAIRLREAIQSAEFQSFLNAVGAAVGRALDLVVRVTSAISSLNITWSNLVPIVTAFLGLKLAELIGGMVVKFLGLNTVLKSISTESGKASASVGKVGKAAAASAAQTEASAKRFSGAWLAEKLGYQQLYEEILRQKKAKDDLRVSTEALASSQRTAAAADNKKTVTATRATLRSGDALFAAEVVRQQGKKVEAALAAEAATAVGIANQRAARLQAAEAESVRRLAVIEQDYQTRRAAIRATGTEVGLKALRAERAAALAEEEARHQRSLAATQRYWDRRAAQAAVGATRASQAERLAYFQASQGLDAAAGAAGTASAGAVSAAAAAAAARQDVAAQVAKQEALKQTSIAGRFQTSVVSGLGAAWAFTTLTLKTGISVLTTLGRGLGFIADIGFRAFAWFGLVYSLADALGFLGPVVSVFRRLGEAVGIYSKEAVAASLSAETLSEKLRKEKDLVMDLVGAYYELQKSKTPKEVEESIAALVQQASKAPTDALRKEAMTSLFNQGNAIFAAVSGSQTVLSDLAKKATEDASRDLLALQKLATDTEARLSRFQETLKAKGTTTLTAPQQITLDTLTATARNAREAYEEARTKADELRKSTDDVGGALVRAQGAASSFSKGVATLFTPQSKQLFDEFVVGLYKLDQQILQFREQYAALSASRPGKDKETTEGIDTQLRALESFTLRAQAARQAMDTAFRKSLTSALAVPNLSKEVQNSLEFLLAFLKEYQSSVPVIAQALSSLPNAQLTGVNAPTPPPQATGNSPFDAKLTGQESLARRLRRAELDTLRAQNEGVANLQQEQFKQLQSISDSAFERGLVSIKDYYAERARIQEAGLQAEIQQRAEDLRAINFQAEAPGIDKGELARLEADRARIRAQLVVLVERKKGIAIQTQEDVERANETFRRSVLSDFAQLSEQGLIPAEAIQVFNRQLESLRANASEKLAKLRTQGRDDLVQGLDNALSLDAIRTTLASQTSQFDNALQELSQARSQIERLQQAGTATTLGAEDALRERITSAVPGLLSLVDAQQKFLDGIEDVTVRASPAFKAFELQVANTRQQVTNLADEIGRTARAINESLTQELADILQNMQRSVEGVKDAFDQFLQAIGGQIIQTAAKQAAESIMAALGSTGAGGIGGFITGLVGGTKPDGTPGNPMYVVFGAAGSKALDSIAQFGQETSLSVQGMWDGVLKGLQNSDNVFLQSIGALLGFLGSSFGALITAIFTTSATESAGSGLSSIASMLSVATAHTGGVIGSKSLEKMLVSPWVFNKARRYHSGGVVGLGADEVPIIGLRGEEVLTEEDPRHRKNLKGGATGDGAMGTVNVWVVTPDQQSSVGPNDIVAVVADNIARRGSIRQLIKQVQLGGG